MQSFSYENQFCLHMNISYFHNNNHALSLAFVMRFKAIGHFRVALNLVMTARLSAKLFI